MLGIVCEMLQPQTDRVTRMRWLWHSLPALIDEEAGGMVGARFLVDEHADLFKGVRYALGEGIEKQESDFAAEVAAAAKS